MRLHFCGQTQDSTSQHMPDPGSWSTQPSVFAILQRSSCSFCRLWTKGAFGTQATAEYADHVKHDVGARKIGRLFAGILRRRNGSVLENLRTSSPSTPEDTWRDLYGYAFMAKHVHKCLSKIEISFVWHSCTAAFRDIFVCQGSARLSFAVSRKAVPRTAPLFWCQEGISYVALDLPGFEAPVTKFVLNFDFDTAHLLQGPDAWEVRSPSSMWFQHWFLVGFFKDSYFKQCQPQDVPSQTAQLWIPHTSHFSNATTETCLWPCSRMLHDA